MKKYSKRGGSPAYELLKQEGLMSAINPVDSSKPLTYVQSGNVSHLIETSGGGRKRVTKKSRRSRSRVSKRTTRNTRRRTRVSRKRSK